MKLKNRMTPLILLLGLVLIAAISAVWFLLPRLPRPGGATTHYESMPPVTTSRWVTGSVARPAVPISNTPITSQNVNRLVEETRWEGFRPRDVVYSPDGSIIAVVTALGPYLYDAEALTLIRWIETKQDVRATAFSPDNTLIALALDDSTIQLRSVIDGSLLQTLDGYSRYIQQLSFDASGELLASGAWDKTARIWSVSDGTLLQTLIGHDDYVQSVALHPDGAYVATASSDGTIRVWRVEDGAEIHSIGKPLVFDFFHFLNINNDFRYSSVGFSPDGRKLVARDNSGFIFVWDFPGGRLIHAFSGRYTPVWGKLQFATNDLLIAPTGEQWDVAQGTIVRDFDLATFDLLFVSPDPTGEYVAAMDAQKNLGVWRISDGAFVKGLWTEGAASFPYSSVAFSPDGNRLFLGDGLGNVEVRQLPQGDKLYTLPHGDVRVSSIAVSPDGTLFAGGAVYDYSSDMEEPGIVHVWRVADGTLQYELSGHIGIEDIQFSLDSHLLATAGLDDGRDHSVRLWDMNNGALVHELHGHNSAVDQIHFSDDGTHLLSVSYQTSLLNWDISTGKSEPIGEPLRYNNDPTFSPDGTLFASRIADSVVSIRSPGNEAPTSTLEHEDHVWSVAFSPDGSLLATGTSSGTLYLWRVADGTLLHKLSAHTDILTTLAFSDDGTTLISAGWDNTLRFWQIQGP